jgi:hypothetical protein
MTGERLVMQESLFYEFRLEDHVPTNHLLRHIDCFVDCSELRQHLAGFYSATGVPSIDSEPRIRILLIDYCLGISHVQPMLSRSHMNASQDGFRHPSSKQMCDLAGH